MKTSNLAINKANILNLVNSAGFALTPEDIRRNLMVACKGTDRANSINDALKALVNEGLIKRFNQGPKSSVYRAA